MMKRFAYVCGLVLVLGILLTASGQAYAQGTLQWTVTFDGSPPIPRGTSKLINYYYEAGMEFRPIGDGQFARSGGGVEGFAENGTACLFAFFGNSLSVSYSGGQRFGVVSVDLAEFSTLYQTPRIVEFIGYRPDGSTVTAQFVTDGVIDGTGPLADFQTFYFDSRFADVTKVEIPTYRWSLDNMVFTAIPEPATSALLFAVGLLIAALKFRK